MVGSVSPPGVISAGGWVVAPSFHPMESPQGTCIPRGRSAVPSPALLDPRPGARGRFWTGHGGTRSPVSGVPPVFWGRPWGGVGRRAGAGAELPLLLPAAPSGARLLGSTWPQPICCLLGRTNTLN